MKLEKAYRYVTIYPVKQCNLSCPRCYWQHCGKKWNDYKGMTWQNWLDVCSSWDKQVKLPFNEITISGGEPTLWPHLKGAMKMIKANGYTKRIRVVTNAINRTEGDYIGADIVQISDYGAMNRKEWYELSRSKKFKTIQNKVIHLPWPYPDWEQHKNTLPAECNCALLAYIGDKVYPCGFRSTMDDGGMSIHDDYYKVYTDQDFNPFYGQLCKKCLSNQKIRTHYAIPPTLEWSVWDCTVGGKYHLTPTKGFWLRKIYNRLRRIKDK